ncbi:bifunctional folylpolyglutamate synthase/dihydrofolate synthase [Ilumatobacter coccineus]|jgi:dihydrofolate synthase / folylpolyglutamate synthase|uniref:tetrahydrofolate synthase n=1 Tax=Ilumatobacter coccineus (strain NBRC 103263 / KCTC 29153 / YM16-304) TaxID=1313172 RepID=A0A6C7E5Q4_ILUCY|nr:folylpolyglutamate synthase/dihydrofolate synthase family protein [Ilumatobacter coccineus]BAN02147.1 folylpolyglutamate synthase [Ilumatobacter coccineus YM16-304]
MDYQAALAYLDEHMSYQKTGRIDSPTIEPITAICGALGDPQLSAPVIHVTGTNGKGSTVQMISRLLAAHGLTVGTYTSPHLEHITERFKRNGESITEEELGEQIGAVAEVAPLVGQNPGYFEILTAAAFRWFADIAVDVMVIEVGLLGRWDATNVVQSQVAVVTNIGMDHNEFAGPSLRHVAEEKAGIVKPGSAVIIGETDPELIEIFENAGGATSLVVGDDFAAVSNALAVNGRLLDLRTPTTIYSDVFVPLNGAHQGTNAAVALAAVETFFAAPLPDDVVHEGFGEVTMPGRFEIMGRQPLTIIDGAHNPQGADTCAEVFFGDFHPEGRRILVVGTLREPAGMLAALRADEFDMVFVCTAPTPRGIPAVELERAAKELGCDHVVAFESVEAACVRAMEYADGDDAVLVTGSLYTAGAARSTLSRLSD